MVPSQESQSTSNVQRLYQLPQLGDYRKAETFVVQPRFTASLLMLSSRRLSTYIVKSVLAMLPGACCKAIAAREGH